MAAVSEEATCAEALELIDREDLRILPVTDAFGCPIGTLSLSHLGGAFIPRASARCRCARSTPP